MSIEKIQALINLEGQRQKSTLSLIASENHSSEAVRAALGSRLTDKYAEGYPGARYYNGCEIVDQIEKLAIDTACKLFDCQYANVQPHSGSQANEAIFSAFLKPGDSILGLDLNHGGHLTHGCKANFSGKLYKPHYYTTNEYGIIDMNHVEDIAKECKPKLIIAGASAYFRIIDWSAFSKIAKEVGAYLLADVAHFSGLIAGGVYPNPVQVADFTTSSTHKILRGPRGGLILSNNLDYAKKIDSAVFPGVQGGPMMHTIAAKGICFAEAMTDNFKLYTKQVVENAKALSDGLLSRGWDIVSGGTDCHMFAIDLRRSHHFSKTHPVSGHDTANRKLAESLSGRDAANLLAKHGIIVNKECVPNEQRSVFETSGIRIGTAAITSRGMTVQDMDLLSEIIDLILNNHDQYHDQYHDHVQTLCQKFPLR